MGHIFISYSHKDTKYAHGLADHLKSRGFEIWIDERLDYGSQWPHEIQKQLDLCDAFLLIMTPRSFASEWVQSEVQRAKRKLKPIFPLLLEGEEPWLSVESTQYFDVRGEVFPDAKFFGALQRVVKVDSRSATYNRLPKPVVPTGKPQPKKRTGLIAAIAGAVTMAICACAVMIVPVMSWLNRELTPTQFSPSVITDPPTHTPSPVISETAVPSPTRTLTLPPTFTEVFTPTTAPTSTLTTTPTFTQTSTQTPTSTPTIKTYSNVATGFCLDSNANNQVYAIGCNGGNYQNWDRQGRRLINVSTGFCLDSNAQGQVYAIACNGGDFQNWDRQGQRLINVATGLCLDSNAQSQVYTLACNGGNYQNWR